MIFSKPHFLILLGGATLAPSFVFGHACEFLSARLNLIHDKHQVELRITADYGGNPMLPDVTAAQKALEEVLHVELQGKSYRLTELAPLQIEKATQWDTSMPASISPPPNGQEHQLLIATWRWEASQPEIAFSVPRESVHDVLLWQQLPGEQDAKSMLLIAGDRSKSLTVHPPISGKAFTTWSLFAGLAFCSGLTFFWRNRRK